MFLEMGQQLLAAVQAGGPESATDIIGWLARRWKIVQQTSEDIRKVVEPVTWIIGSVLALIPGSFAIWKWIYFRYSRLPQRFDDMLRREEARLANARTALLETIKRPTTVKNFKAPIFVAPEMATALRRMKWASWWKRGELGQAEKALDKALDALASQMNYWEAHQASYKRQKATALLLKGAVAAAAGQRALSNGKDGDGYHRTALSHFLQALEIDENDVEPIEYAAHQYRVLSQYEDARTLYLKLANLEDQPEPEHKLMRARALRYAGEMSEKLYDSTKVGARLSEAKSQLDKAFEELPAAAKGELDHAYICRALATVEDKNQTAQLWHQYFFQAENIYLNLLHRGKDAEEAQRGLDEMRELRDAIVARRNGTASLPPPPSNGSPKSN